MKNKQIDLTNHLFAQLERLNDEDLTPEKLSFEIERTRSIALISKEIHANEKLALDAQRLLSEAEINGKPQFFTGSLSNGKQNNLLS